MILAITNKNALQVTNEGELKVLEQYPNFYFAVDDKQIGSVKLLQREKKSLVEIRDLEMKLITSFKIGSLVTNACYSNHVLAFLNSDGQLILYSNKYKRIGNKSTAYDSMITDLKLEGSRFILCALDGYQEGYLLENSCAPLAALCVSIFAISFVYMLVNV